MPGGGCAGRLTRPEKTIHNNKVYEKGKRGFIKGNPT
jgi:hypothetical protein